MPVRKNLERHVPGTLKARLPVVDVLPPTCFGNAPKLYGHPQLGAFLTIANSLVVN